MIIDTHAHLNFPDFENDLDKVVENSLKNGVTKIICVSSNIADSEKSLEIAEKYPKIVFPAVGIHPQQTDPENKDSLGSQLDQLDKLAQLSIVVAIGECGLDYAPAPPPEKDRSKEEQLTLFRGQVKIALKHNLPLIIHSRKSFDDAIQILKSTIDNSQLAISNLKGVIHCYTGGKKGIKKVEEIGFLFGIDGNLTYDTGLQNVVEEIPLEKILLETDAPWLAPLPHRGLRNEPANVKIIAEFLARLKDVSFNRVAQVTTKNAETLFKL